MKQVNDLTAKITSLLSEMKRLEPKTFNRWVDRLQHLAEDLESDCGQAKRWARFKAPEIGTRFIYRLNGVSRQGIVVSAEETPTETIVHVKFDDGVGTTFYNDSFFNYNLTDGESVEILKKGD